MIVMQAQLVWSSADSEELHDFIESGSWNGETECDVLPYSPALREAITSQWGK